MKWSKKEYQVYPNTQGYLYINNQLDRVLDPGVYRLGGWKKEIMIIPVDLSPQLLRVLSQEVLTQDNISLRFSYMVSYKIINGKKFLSNFDFGSNLYNIQSGSQELLHTHSQIVLRDVLSTINSEDITAKRQGIFDTALSLLQKRVDVLGIKIEEIGLIDVQFPKNIQDIFAQRLQAQIRSQADLENARSQVASARALKNAADMMKENENLRYLQWLETVREIAKSGKHTFILGEAKEAILK